MLSGSNKSILPQFPAANESKIEYNQEQYTTDMNAARQRSIFFFRVINAIIQYSYRDLAI